MYFVKNQAFLKPLEIFSCLLTILMFELLLLPVFAKKCP